MAHQLALVHAEHAAIGQNRAADFLDALIDVEEDDEEHQRDAERHLRPYAQPEPQREDWRQDDARQRVCHLHIGIEDCRYPRLARKPKPEQYAAKRADHESQDRFPQRDRQMFPDRAGDEPGYDLCTDIDRIGKEERRQYHPAEDRHGTEQLPQPDNDHGDQQLAEQQMKPVHGAAPATCEDCT